MTEKRHYAYNEPIPITFHRDQPLGKGRFNEWLGVYPSHDLTEDMITATNENLKRWKRHSRMWMYTCGSTSCPSARVEHATVVFGPEAHPWPLSQGCWKLALVGWLGWKRGGWKIVAVSEEFSVGAQDMTLCKPPTWSPLSNSTATHVATLGRGDGFSVIVHRFPVAGRPFEPLGGFKTHPDEGKLRIEKPTRHWFFGPGTHHGNYGHARKLFPTLRSDGTEGVVWKDYDTETIKATWLSRDMLSAETHTIYGTRSDLAAVAFNGNDALIMLLIVDVSQARLVKMSCTAREILAETETFALGRFGTKFFHKEAMASMVWNVEANTVGLVISGRLAWTDHQGACRSIIDATTLEKLQGPHQTASHSWGNSLVLGSDGNFIEMDLADNYPRGVALLQFNAGASSSSFVPYTFKTWHGTRSNGKAVYEELSTAERTFYKWSNDNNVYTELAHAGVVEVDDGYVVFFSGERPSLDTSMMGSALNVGRNAGLVKVGKDLRKQEVLSKGSTETGEYYDFAGGYHRQENKGIKWITNFSDVQTSVSRMKTARLEDGRILLYWEVWGPETYQYSQMSVLSDDGTPQAGPWLVGSRMALPFADDLLEVGRGRAVAYAGNCDTVCEVKGRGGACEQTDCYLMRYELCAAADC